MKNVYTYSAITLLLLIGGVVTYNFFTLQSETVQEHAERVNQDILKSCIRNITATGTAQELSRAFEKCAKTPLLHISSGTVAPANSGAPGYQINTQKNAKSLPDSQKGVPPKPQTIGAPKAQRVQVAEAHQDGGTLPPSQDAGDARALGEQGEAKYWKAYEVAVRLIHKYEGINLHAYEDSRGCSIGWGTRAKSCSETITAKEADARLMPILKQVLANVQKTFPNLHAEGQGALVSFAFNCHAGWRDVMKNGIQNHSQWCRVSRDSKGNIIAKYTKGLTARREEEQNLLFSKK